MKARPKAKRIPIREGKHVAVTYGYDQVIIFARRVGADGMEHVTTYGRNKEHCQIAGRIGDHLKQVLGWKNDGSRKAD